MKMIGKNPKNLKKKVMPYILKEITVMRNGTDGVVLILMKILVRLKMYYGIILEKVSLGEKIGSLEMERDLIKIILEKEKEKEKKTEIMVLMQKEEKETGKHAGFVV